VVLAKIDIGEAVMNEPRPRFA